MRVKKPRISASVYNRDSLTGGLAASCGFDSLTPDIFLTLKLIIMKAQITELWNTGREIITTVSENSENEGFERVSCLADLSQYENVIYDRKEKTAMIDNNLVSVSFRKVQHPSGGGSLYVVEVDYYI